MSRIIACGDLHLYHEGTEDDAVSAFVADLLADPPDTLVLGGDIYELWRRDLSGAPWMATDFTDAILDLRDRGTTVHYLAGNHDEYLLRHLENDDRYPFDATLDLVLEDAGETFFFTHGHKYEPAYNPINNDLLALTDDHAGRVADWLWRNRPAPNNPAERAAGLLAGPVASFFNPEDLRANALRRRAVDSGVATESGDGRWGVYGHTHVPGVDRDRLLANWGSMTAGQATYLEITDGTPVLRSVRE